MAGRVHPAELAAALTWARTKPAEAAEVLSQRVPRYKKNDYFPIGRQGACVVTKEGAAAVLEAIDVLKKMRPVGDVGTESVIGLGVAAEDHVADIGFTGQVSHASSDGTNSFLRAQRYGDMKHFGESLWYGSDKADARCIVLDLIVDDGVESRGHRTCVLNPDYTVVGCAYGPHATYGTIAAMSFASDFRPNDTAVSARQKSGPIKVAGQAEAKKKVSTQWKVIGMCPVCREPIRGGAVVEIEQVGGKLHKACFNCSECTKPLSGVPFNVHQKTPFCKECYFEKHGEKCTACGKAIAGGKAKCSLGVFHVECLVCTVCNTSIGKNPFSTESGVLTCKACAGGSRLGGGAKPAGAADRSSSAPGAQAERSKMSPASTLRSCVADRGLAAASAASRGQSSTQAGGARARSPRAEPKATGVASRGASPAGSSARSAPGASFSGGGRARSPPGATGVAARGTGAEPKATGAAARGASPVGSTSRLAPGGFSGGGSTTGSLAALGGTAGARSASGTSAAGKAKAKASPKAVGKVSLAKAGASVIGLGMDYANL